ncbi:hypothetical protein EX30DRAFT_214608 [Ascodesmis nigricans]|uniref:Uncharacterized protein n=1 Tax=Ascodesmis nigricans TaxID=341454 RepID=A0A4S2MZL8_9PEZI|nr:hypothetical protein EX30DRAFT_214608 [Ascodesmis nigricans]
MFCGKSDLREWLECSDAPTHSPNPPHVHHHHHHHHHHNINLLRLHLLRLGCRYANIAVLTVLSMVWVRALNTTCPGVMDGQCCRQRECRIDWSISLPFFYRLVMNAGL